VTSLMKRINNIIKNSNMYVFAQNNSKDLTITLASKTGFDVEILNFICCQL